MALRVVATCREEGGHRFVRLLAYEVLKRSFMDVMQNNGGATTRGGWEGEMYVSRSHSKG
jgi:hypothetical protein